MYGSKKPHLKQAAVILLVCSVWTCAQETAPATAPADPLMQARVLLEAGSPEKALQVASGALESSPNDLELLLLACEAALGAGNHRLARHYSDRATGVAPADPRGYEWAGFVLFRLAEHERDRPGFGGIATATLLDAAHAHSEAARLGGDPYRNGYFEADAYRLAKSWEKALAACDKVLTFRPKDPPTRLLKGRMFVESGNHVSALAEFEGILAEHPDSEAAGEAAVGVIEALLATGDRARLQWRFSALTSRYPKIPAARMYRAVCEAFRGAGDEPFWPNLLESLSTRGDKDPIGIYYRGEWALRRLEYERARDLFGRYCNLMPDDPWGWH